MYVCVCDFAESHFVAPSEAPDTQLSSKNFAKFLKVAYPDWSSKLALAAPVRHPKQQRTARKLKISSESSSSTGKTSALSSTSQSLREDESVGHESVPQNMTEKGAPRVLVVTSAAKKAVELVRYDVASMVTLFDLTCLQRVSVPGRGRKRSTYTHS